MDIRKVLCCCCFTPDEWRWYGKQKPWFEPFDKCKKRAKQSVLQDLLRMPGATERNMKSLLLSDLPQKKCKCDEAWNTNRAFSIPFSTDAANALRDMQENLILQQLMKRLGFLDNGEDITQAEKRMLRQWLKELNYYYNLQNGNALDDKKGEGRQQMGGLNYLDYSLFKYEDDDRDWANKGDKKKKLSIRKHINLPKDVRDDLKKMSRLLHKSFNWKQKKKVEAKLFYQPVTKDDANMWKSFDAKLGAQGLVDKLNSLDCLLDFSEWTLRALNYIIKGEVVPASLYDHDKVKDLQDTLNKLMITIHQPKYDFFGFPIPVKKRGRK